MTKSLGSSLPDDLFRRLSSRDPSALGQRVILFTTVDEDGWPRHGMLSHFEVVAKDRSSVLMLTYHGSSSTSNLIRTGKALLLFVDEEMSYYVRVHCREVQKPRDLIDAPHETLFECSVVDIMEDKLPTARITSGLTFSGYDPGMPREQRVLVRSELLRYSS